MERRGFLKSFVGGITGAGLLLKATPAEVKAFGAKVDDAVILSPQAIAKPVAPAAVHSGEVLYDARGRAVAMVTDVRVTANPIETTSVWDEYLTFRPGLREVEIRAHGLPASVDWLQDSLARGARR